MTGFYRDENDEWHCERCMFATPHLSRMQHHVEEKHGVEPPVPASVQQQWPTMTVAEALAAVESGSLPMWDAVEIEVTREHPRRTLIHGLRVIAERPVAAVTGQGE